MNRYFEDAVERAWQSMSPELKIRIQREMGFNRNDVSAVELTDLTIDYLKKKIEELKWNKLRKELKKNIEELGEDLERRNMNYLDSLRKETMEGLKEIAYVLGEKYNEILHQIEDIKTQKSIPAHLSGDTSTQSVIMVGTSYSMDCKYAKEGGPKDCLHIRDTPNGRFVQCETAVNLQNRIILHPLLTTAYGLVGCPSNKLIEPCRYVDGEEYNITGKD